jgi:hypothetical protein
MVCFYTFNIHEGIINYIENMFSSYSIYIKHIQLVSMVSKDI